MSLDPLGPVTIGAREIYDELKTVGSKLDRLDGKVDGTVAEVADHETRIRKLERVVWIAAGAAAAGGGVVGAVIRQAVGG
ncbi:hypothetical protein [Microbispora rosea]